MKKDMSKSVCKGEAWSIYRSSLALLAAASHTDGMTIRFRHLLMQEAAELGKLAIKTHKP